MTFVLRKACPFFSARLCAGVDKYCTKQHKYGKYFVLWEKAGFWQASRADYGVNVCALSRYFLLSEQVFEMIVKDLLVKNGHRATVEGVPNTELEAAIDGKEKGLLDEIKKSMSDEVSLWGGRGRGGTVLMINACQSHWPVYRASGAGVMGRVCRRRRPRFAKMMTRLAMIAILTLGVDMPTEDVFWGGRGVSKLFSGIFLRVMPLVCLLWAASFFAELNHRRRCCAKCARGVASMKCGWIVVAGFVCLKRRLRFVL